MSFFRFLSRRKSGRGDKRYRKQPDGQDRQDTRPAKPPKGKIPCSVLLLDGTDLHVHIGVSGHCAGLVQVLGLVARWLVSNQSINQNEKFCYGQ
jgi:hypothetical protein